jgi:hypothetical protein
MWVSEHSQGFKVSDWASISDAQQAGRVKMRFTPFLPGIYGYVTLLVGTIVIFLTLPAHLQVIYCGILLVYALLFHRDAFRKMVKLPLILFCLSVLAMSFSQPPNSLNRSDGIPGICMGFLMLMRAAGIISAAQILAYRVSVKDIIKLTDAFGARGFGFALGISFHMLPLVHQTARQTYEVMRLRGAFSRRRTYHSIQWISAIAVQVLRKSDNIIASARSRGYGSRNLKISLARLSQGDVLVFISIGLILLLGILS